MLNPQVVEFPSVSLFNIRKQDIECFMFNFYVFIVLLARSEKVSCLNLLPNDTVRYSDFGHSNKQG